MSNANIPAQGFIEVKGYVAAIEAADVMSKAADVRVSRVHKVDGPCVCVICEGDVAACQAAVDAAASVSSAKGLFLAGSVIPSPACDPTNPDAGLHAMLDGINQAKAARKKIRAAAAAAFVRASGPDAAAASAKAAKKSARK